jgi:PiT family inorganic phosphate transporter
MLLIFLFVAALFLSYSNGANDNFKGVATLFGGGILSFKKALIWSTVTTVLGSITSIFLAEKLVKNFSGKGLVPDALLLTPEFAIAITFGAAVTVFFATKIGMPISTTHALVGGLLGCGIIAVGSDFNFVKLGTTFLIPLVFSPLVATFLSFITYYIVHKLTKKESSTRINQLHFVSSGVVCFSRALNDTPKIAALLLLVSFLDLKFGMLTIALAMALGGVLNSRKVAEIMSSKITPMNANQGFTANLITGILVSTASVIGLPVSTTHVSVGSIFGIGIISKKSDYSVIRNILMSWVLTLPFAAIVSSISYLALVFFLK